MEPGVPSATTPGTTLTPGLLAGADAYVGCIIMLWYMARPVCFCMPVCIDTVGMRISSLRTCSCCVQCNHKISECALYSVWDEIQGIALFSWLTKALILRKFSSKYRISKIITMYCLWSELHYTLVCTLVFFFFFRVIRAIKSR